MKYLLCEIESYFCEIQDGSMCRVSKPLQVFNTREEAEAAEELFNGFYDYNLRVVPESMLHKEFR